MVMDRTNIATVHIGRNFGISPTASASPPCRLEMYLFYCPGEDSSAGARPEPTSAGERPAAA